MRRRRLTVALAGMLWTALSYGVLFAAFWLLDPLLDGLPRVSQALWVAAMVALMVYAPPAFPFWRARLTVDDRRRVFYGSGAGAVLGLFVGGTAALAVLEADFTSIFQSTRSTTVLWSCLVVSAMAGAYRSATPPRYDGPIVSDSPA